MRLFIAIPINSELKKQLSKFTENYSNIPAKWTKPKNMHITVQFLGKIEEGNLEDIKKDLFEITANIKRFELKFDEIIYGPPNKKPCMIWAIFKGNDDYEKIVKNTTQKLNRYTDQNLHGEHVMRKKRISHVTLARFRNPHVIAKNRLNKINVQNPRLNVASLELWQSELTSEGPIYKTLEKFSLK